ncbi:MAG: toxin [Patescibacteria group bacterium]
MKYFDWNKEKNEQLKEERDISFEEVSEAIIDQKILDAFEHPNQDKYPNQKVVVVEIRDYAYFVAYVEDEEKIFLKTVYPDRDLTKKYLRK